MPLDLPAGVTAELPQTIDSTMLTTFRACPRKFYYEFVLGLRPARTSIHLHAGGAIASAIERVRKGVYNEGLTTNRALQLAFADFKEFWGEDFPVPEDSHKTFFNCFRSVVSYFEFWDPKTDPIQPFDFGHGGTFEFSFALPTRVLHPSGQPFLFAGRADMLGKYLGKPCIVDEKTSKSQSSSFAFKWGMRGQFLGYIKAIRDTLGLKVDTAVIRGTALLKTEIKHQQAIQTYADFLIERWSEELERTLLAIRHCWETETWPYNFGDSCDAYGECPFKIVCTARDQEVWLKDYVVRRWNPLLRNPIDNRRLDLEMSRPILTADPPKELI